MAIRSHKFSFILIFVVFSSFTIPNLISGTYWGPNKKSKIEFYEKDKQYFGKLVMSDYTQTLDIYNPDSHLKSRELVGINIFFNLNYNHYLKVWKGKIYDPTSGEFYNCDLWLTNNNKSLVVRGYSEHSFLTQIETLERIN